MAPRWAHAPLSGEGAAITGGRFNEIGVPALYLSEAIMVAVAEYGQDLPYRPGTYVRYALDVAGVVDLTAAAARAALAVSEEMLLAPWKEEALVHRRRPPTWDIARRLIDDGAAGIRVPSVQVSAGRNIVLWRWNDAVDRQVRAFDPLDDLPRDQSSWRD